MIADCRVNRPAGWSYLVGNYVPVMRLVLSHYYPDRKADRELLDQVLKALHDPLAALFAHPGAGTEREFVTALRQAVLAAVEKESANQTSAGALDLETMTAALEEFTATERQFVWLESMAYTAEQTAALMNLEASTVENARNRAEELLRSRMDHWKRGLIADTGRILGRLAAAARTEECLPARAFLDTLDGRITWIRKKDCEFHMMSCWHCIDHFCRIREADHALRVARPLGEDEAMPYRLALGLPEEKQPFWKKMFAP